MEKENDKVLSVDYEALANGEWDKCQEALSEGILNFAKEVTGRLQNAGYAAEDISWLQVWPIINGPSWQGAAVRVKDAVISFNFTVCEPADEEGMLDMSTAIGIPDIPMQEHFGFCHENDIIPYEIMLDASDLSHYNYMEPRLGDDLEENPGESPFLVGPLSRYKGPGLMSEWEINNAAVQRTRQYLEGKGVEDFQINDSEGVFPQILFRDTDGVTKYVFVAGHAVGNPAPEIPEGMVERCQEAGIPGFYVNLPLANFHGNGDFNDITIPRGSELVGDVRELIPMEQKLSETEE